MKNEILVTTTDILQGYIIDEYWGYMSESSVIGTGFITDIAASLANFTGTQSFAVTNKLYDLKQRVLTALKIKAGNARCNGLVGLTIDVDEIASGQKMMFMVTASATAVKCHKENEAIEHYQTIDKECVPYSLIQETAYSIALGKDLKTYAQCLKNHDNCNLSAIKSRILECKFLDVGLINIADFLLCLVYLDEFYDEALFDLIYRFDQKSVFQSFLSLTYDLSINDQNHLLKLKKSKAFASLIIRVGSFNDYPLILNYLRKGEEQFNDVVLYPLLNQHKNFYSKSDNGVIQKIVDIMKLSYWNEDCVNLHELSSSHYRLCSCGNLVEENKVCSCGSCDSISIATYMYKRETVNLLTKLINELSDYFCNINAINMQ